MKTRGNHPKKKERWREEKKEAKKGRKRQKQTGQTNGQVTVDERINRERNPVTSINRLSRQRRSPLTIFLQRLIRQADRCMQSVNNRRCSGRRLPPCVIIDLAISRHLSLFLVLLHYSSLFASFLLPTERRLMDRAERKANRKKEKERKMKREKSER